MILAAFAILVVGMFLGACLALHLEGLLCHNPQDRPPRPEHLPAVTIEAGQVFTLPYMKRDWDGLVISAVPAGTLPAPRDGVEWRLP